MIARSSRISSGSTSRVPLGMWCVTGGDDTVPPMLAPSPLAAAAARRRRPGHPRRPNLDKAKDQQPGSPSCCPRRSRPRVPEASTAPRRDVGEGRYTLVIGAAKNCNGASVCGVATFVGGRGRGRRGGRKVAARQGPHGPLLQVHLRRQLLVPGDRVERAAASPTRSSQGLATGRERTWSSSPTRRSDGRSRR